MTTAALRSTVYLYSMKQVKLYRFWTPTIKGKLSLSRYAMTVEEAAERFPGCKPALGTLEVRHLPETDEERATLGVSPHARLDPTPSWRDVTGKRTTLT